MEYIGIDPGVRESYIAVIRDGELHDVFPCASDIDSLFKQFKRGSSYDISFAVIEQPDRVDPKSTLTDILNLMRVVGRLEAVIEWSGPILSIVKPLEWKGQTKKHVTKNRVLERFPETERLLSGIPELKKHNYYDAIGIAMYCERVNQ